MAITTKTLAEKCNVSRTTVTRALSGTGRINKDTKQFILDTARELGYQPDLLARSLVKGRSMTIGVVLCDLKNMYFPQVIDAMEKIARDNEYILNITLHDNNKATEKHIIQQLAGHRIDGLILDLASNEMSNYEYLKEYNFPIIIIGGQKLDGFPYVGNDEFHAAWDATLAIAQAGYDTMYFVFPGLDGRSEDSFGGHKERLRGAKKAAQASGMNFGVIGSDDYVSKVNDVMKTASDKTAFLCSGDLYAGYIMMNLTENGYTAGVDYGIMGFDHLDLMNMFPRKLTTIENNIQAVGTASMELLLSIIQESAASDIIDIPYQLIAGDTL